MSDEPIDPKAVVAPPTSAKARALVENWVGRFVRLTDEQKLICALWVMHTWAFEAANVTPYLQIVSPAPDCGKSTLAEVLLVVARRGELLADPTGPLLFRMIEKERPTICLDEIEHTLGAEERRQVLAFLNAGYRQGGSVPRLKPPTFTDYERFSVFSPKILCGLDGALPATTASRCLRVEMKPATDDELSTLEPFIYSDVSEDAAELRARLEAWAGSELPTLETRPESDVLGLRPREREVSRPLLVLAAKAECDEELRAALTALFAGKRSTLVEGVTLLRYVKTVFASYGDPEHLFTAVLVQQLVSLPESPYAERWGREDWTTGDVKALKVAGRKLADALRPFGIGSHNIKDPVTGNGLKGYRRVDFEDAWKRYRIEVEEEPQEAAPPESADHDATNATSAQPRGFEGDSFNATEAAGRVDGKGRKPFARAKVAWVAAKNPDSGEGAVAETTAERLQREYEEGL